jgi:hypothetical protein
MLSLQNKSDENFSYNKRKTKKEVRNGINRRRDLNRRRV